MDVQIDALKVMEFGCEIEDALHQGRIDFERHRVGFLVELAKIVSCRAILAHLNLYVFRVTGFEDLAINDGRAISRSAGEC